jgi:hypothetical protein
VQAKQITARENIMLWKILGVVLGYILIAVLTFMTFSAFYLAIGADRAYNPGTYDVSPLWIAVSALLTLLAGLAGGYVCKSVSGDKGTVVILAGIVLGLGIAVASLQAVTKKPSTEVRTSAVSNYEAMKKPQQPVWYLFASPIISAAGIIIGGGAMPRKKEEE